MLDCRITYHRAQIKPVFTLRPQFSRRRVSHLGPVPLGTAEPPSSPNVKTQITDMEPGSLCAQRLFIIQKEGGEREEKTRTPHGALEKVNRKAPLLPLATDPEDSSCRDLRGGLEASRRPGSSAVGWEQNPHRGRSRTRNGFCVHKISLFKRHWWR